MSKYMSDVKKWLSLVVNHQSRKKRVKPCETIAYKARSRIEELEKQNLDLSLKLTEINELSGIPTVHGEIDDR